MKKLLIILPVLLTLMLSISASDFSLRGDKNLIIQNNVYKTTFSVWHNDNQGQGSISIEGNNIKEYLKLEQVSFHEYPNYVYVITRAKGTYWQKGIKPVPVDFNWGYIYYKNTKQTDFGSFQIPVKEV